MQSKSKQAIQLTVRGVPQQVAETYRQKAHRSGKSLNRVLVEALTAAAGLGKEQIRYRELSDLAGTWVEDPAFDAAIAEQHRIDEEMWA